MSLTSRLRNVPALVCAVASLIAIACPSQAQQLFPTDRFPFFKNLIEREVPPPSKKVAPQAPSNKAQAQASFDCRRARLPSEKTICTHPDLAALDRQMGDIYARRLAPADVRTREELAAEQRQWLAQRDACGRDEVCLADAIERRLAALSPPDHLAQPVDAPASPPSSGTFQMLQDFDLPYGDYRSGMQDPSLRGVTLDTCEAQCTLDDRCQSFTYNVKARVCLLKQEVPASQPFRGAVSGIKLAGGTAAVVANDVQPADGTHPAGAGIATATRQSAVSVDDELARLSSPPPGMKPLVFEHVDGRPVVTEEQASNLFDLIRYAANDKKQTDEYREIEAIRAFLTAEARNELCTPVSCTFSSKLFWKGSNEFEKTDARQLFEREYLPSILKIAPKLPFVFTFALKDYITIDTYNDGSESFPIRTIKMGRLLDGNVGGALGDARSVSLDFEPPLARDPGRNSLTRLFWHVPRAQAPDVLRQFPMRSVMLTAQLDVKSVDDTGQIHIGLDALALYTPDGRTKLADLPVPDDAPPPTPEPSSHPAVANAVSNADAAAPPAAPPTIVAPGTDVSGAGIAAEDGQQAISIDDVAARLSSPPQGVKPWIFDHVGGHPAMTAGQVSDLFDLIRMSRRDDRQQPDRITMNFLTKEAYEDVVNILHPIYWAGRDEFEQADAKRSFETKYLPALLKVRPKAPFAFRLFNAVRLKEYDAKSGAFPIWLANLPDWLGGLGQNISSDFTPPSDLLWHVQQAQARRALRQLGDERSVMLVADVKVTSIDEATGHIRLGLDALNIYSPDGRTKLADFPVRNDAAPILSAETPSALRFTLPPLLDQQAFCAELLSTYGARTPDDVFQRCWNDIADRDADFYASNASANSLAADDARRPFFPRGGAKLDDRGRAAFLRWFSAYAAGLAAQVVVLPVTSGSYKPGSGLPFWPAPSVYDVKSLLDREGLQLDQLGLTALYSTPIIFALPNGVMAYATIPPPGKVTGVSDPLSARVSFHLGKASAQAYEDGRPALLLQLTPQSIDVSSKEVSIYSHSFDDVPALSTTFTDSQATSPAQKAAGPVPLDSGLVNLLAASTAGGTLPQEALANMVNQRWVVENKQDKLVDLGWVAKNSSPAVSSDRFFVVGKRQPTPEEAAGLGAQFIAWAKGNAPSLPARVTLSRKLSVRKGQGFSWGDLGFGSYGYSDGTMASNAIDDLQRKVASGAANRQEKLQFVAGQAANVSFSLLREAGYSFGKTTSYYDIVAYFDKAVVPIFRFDQAIPSSNIDFLGDTKDILVNVALDITGVNWSAQPPLGIDALPGDMQALFAQRVGPSNANVKPGAEFVTLDVRLVSGQILDMAGKQLATIEPSDPSPVQSLISQFRKQQAEPDAPKPAAPPQPAAPLLAATQAYGPDLIGVRLGMSFEAAEDIVRKHMEVGQVLEGRRAFDDEIKSGFNVPLTSGKLFISKDNREFIALIDEPPAADKRVVAAWRRVYAPPETYQPEELFSKIKEKYGPPKMEGGLMGNWYEADVNQCSWLLQVNPKPLAETWMDAGQPANIAVPNRSAYSNAGPFFPIRFYDPLSQKPSDCGPVVYAAIFKAQPPFSPMTELDMTLTDLDNYVAAYSASRKLLQAQAATAGASVGNGSPAIKF
ncbi:hypothetical protein ELH06_38365 [Rhizobium ruizarguesonis]|uniref:PAN domain-containing protein n=1 Tax=Rhizobium ruizarguesonis TaxID=2081791 RepID=UPI0010312078|nr:PAN domain-containing protein [Rhizobium ruizarguesonis]TBE36219.1 hypothetical protein ELH06_38365 [Rhizobium ruizarguesonis]